MTGSVIGDVTRRQLVDLPARRAGRLTRAGAEKYASTPRSLISSAPSRRTSELRDKPPTTRARGAGAGDQPRRRRRLRAQRGERVKLADGAEIVIRPIEPEDLNELAIGFGGLGRSRGFAGSVSASIA